MSCQHLRRNSHATLSNASSRYLSVGQSGDETHPKLRMTEEEELKKQAVAAVSVAVGVGSKQAGHLSTNKDGPAVQP